MPSGKASGIGGTVFEAFQQRIVLCCSCLCHRGIQLLTDVCPACSMSITSSMSCGRQAAAAVPPLEHHVLDESKKPGDACI